MKKTTTKRAPKKTTSSKKPVAVFQTGADLKTSLLIVSVLINLFVLCIWVALKMTTVYDASLSQVFLGR